mmetsp:Transcript_2417/g.3708  ORF Transcript_2417/g.3708 Transcript_2417/m.3708 type:complete len:115 (-) Transcript_2417:101-445(-)
MSNLSPIHQAVDEVMKLSPTTQGVLGAVFVAQMSFVVLLVMTRKAKSGIINPSIKKDQEKVVDMVNVADVAFNDKGVAAYCRCWRSKTFPLCDGSHNAFNKEVGDNVAPLVLKK